MAESRLLAFHRGTGADHAGRRLADILAWDAARLEATHDYIQWLFPLPEPSAYNPHAPLLSAADTAAFQAEPALRAGLRRAFLRMLDFYGLECEDADPRQVSIRKAAGFAACSAGWLTPGNHNHLRLTRILRCLTLLGLPGHARALLACLEAIRGEAPAAIGAGTLAYWRRAAAG